MSGRAGQAERCLRHARVLFAQGEATRCRERLDEGLELAAGLHHPVEAGLLVLTAQLTAWQFDAAESLKAARKAALVARRRKAFMPDAELVLGQALFVAGSPACVSHFAAARRMAESSSQIDLELEALSSYASALQAFGRSRACITSSLGLAKVAAARRKPIWEQQALWRAARVGWLAFGDIEGAIPVFRSLLGKKALGLHRPQLLADLAVALADNGDLEAARQMIRQAESSASTQWTVGVAAFYRAEIEWASGRPARSLAAAEQALLGDLPLPVELVARGTRLWSLFELGAPEPDERLAVKTFPLLKGLTAENAAFAAFRHRRFDEAERLFRDAASAWSANILRNELRALWGAARVASERGESVNAREQLVVLERRARRLGQLPILTRIRATLHSLETGGRGSKRSGKLSPREREILHLVARGQSSKEIGTTLGIARSTVETHIRAAMGKLGAATRVQAAGLVILAEAGHRRWPESALPLLGLLVHGATVSEAAIALGISRRTSTRLLERTRASLGVRTNAETILLYAADHHVDSDIGALQPVRAA